MMKYEFEIPGNPVAWKRPGGTFRRYDEQKNDKLAIGLSFKQLYRNHKPLTNFIVVIAIFYLPIPKSLSKKIQEGDPCLKKPDKDNLEKILLDALTNAGVWKDDAQVVMGFQAKIYSNNPRTWVRISGFNIDEMRKLFEHMEAVFNLPH